MQMNIHRSIRSLAVLMALCVAVLCAFPMPVQAAGQGYSDMYQISVLSGVGMDSNVSAVALLYGDEKGSSSGNYAVIMKSNDKRGDLVLDVISAAKYQELAAGSLAVSQMSTSAYNAFMLENGVSDEYLMLDQKPPIVDEILRAAANGDNKLKIEAPLVIQPEALKLAAEKCGRDFFIQCDTTYNNKLDVRVTLTPSQATKGIVPAALVADGEIRDILEKKYNRKFGVIQFFQEGSFGTTVKVTARVDLRNLDTDNLIFYSLNRITNKYTLVENTNYTIDSKGFLVFYTDRGNTMLITDKKLK